MRFEWDPGKDRINETRLFTSGLDYPEVYDEAHSIEEDRFIAIGVIGRGTIVVAYSEREDEVIRIVSARMATRAEAHRFEMFPRGKR